MLSPNFFIEGTYSNRNLKFINSGATTTDVIDGTLVVDVARNSRYWAPTFCGVCGVDEERNNNTVLKGTYFASTRNSGSHNLVFGYDTFNDIRLAENHQSGSDYRILGTTSLIRDGVVVELDARLEHPDPVEPDRCGQPRHQLRTHSLFVNDQWRLTNRVTINAGLRWDRNDGKDSVGNVVAKDSGFSPAGSDVRPDRRLDVDGERELRRASPASPTTSLTPARTAASSRPTCSTISGRRSTPTRGADERAGPDRCRAPCCNGTGSTPTAARRGPSPASTSPA